MKEIKRYIQNIDSSLKKLKSGILPYENESGKIEVSLHCFPNISSLLLDIVEIKCFVEDHKAVVEIRDKTIFTLTNLNENKTKYICELEKENKELKENILEIVDQCFHAYASSSRGEAVEYAQELMGESK